MPIAFSPQFVLDCPDPTRMAEFYGALLGWPPKVATDGGWATISSGEHHIHFQRVDDFRAPQWPGQEHPQQIHLDVDVVDLDESEAATLALGAVKHEHQPGTDFRVFLDPAGHPFCLCRV
ncbi:VOC family protein [Nocardioides caeni]|uniref:VOC family protein n=1 Tax=Nocardioides caeni TaxID=574700 RepID=A0A4S8N4Q5_9ACTN|nr:VOC family protein [Nocardioides caeni]THV09899.1 VOC family protein [Nocardioides caeni]